MVVHRHPPGTPFPLGNPLSAGATIVVDGRLPPAPRWQWCKVWGTRHYRLWRYHPHALSSVTGQAGIEQHAAVVDDYGNLIFVTIQ